jgi:hypothetical protein
MDTDEKLRRARRKVESRDGAGHGEQVEADPGHDMENEAQARNACAAMPRNAPANI